MNLPIEAKQSLEKALAIEPDNPNYNYAMGSVILQTRDAASAGSYFAKYVKARPGDARGHYALGLAFFTSGDYDHAKNEMHIAEKSADLRPAAEYYLGRMARLDGDLNLAVRRLNEALALRAKFSEPHTELARIALQRGDTKTAQAELEQALRYAPENFQANEQLLILYKRTHDPRAVKQEEVLKKLDEERSKRADLMLRTLDMRPQP
jgi:tetratricopeptide (TPR) repeat protein